MARMYFIDIENTGKRWENVVQPEKDDMVYIFYTKASDAISLDVLRNNPREIYVKRTPAGNQALDMCLVSYLGFKIRDSVRCYDDFNQYIIVSNDKGYDSVVEFWSNQTVDGSRISISRIPFSVCGNDDKECHDDTAEKEGSSDGTKDTAKNGAPVAETEKKNEKKSKDKQEFNRLLNMKCQRFCNAQGFSQKDSGQICSTLIGSVDEDYKIKIKKRTFTMKFGEQAGKRYYEAVKAAVKSGELA